jgi:hypothetical protein
VGIDVACARFKRLPICFAALNGKRLEPLSLPDALAAKIPVGSGNIEIQEASPFNSTAAALVDALDEIAKEQDWRIARVAMDAPAAPPRTGERASEVALRKLGLASFQTPDVSRWIEVKSACRGHLEAHRPLAHLPHANKVWMLYGFEIFNALRAKSAIEAIEVYPYAIVRALVPACPHKSSLEGYRRQLEAVAAATGWTGADLQEVLSRAVPGRIHDRLDAFMSAWVASLDGQQRRAYGNENDRDDAIWVALTR